MKISLVVGRPRDAALDAIVSACRSSRACAASHPDPAATLAAIASALGANGKPVTVTDPQTGEPLEVQVTYDLVLGALQPLIYAPEAASLIPEILDRARS